MRRLFLTTIIASMAMNIGLYAQETAQTELEVKLELVYSLDQNQLTTETNPLSEIIQAIKNKAKDVPQEDIDWVLNKVQLDILRKTQILHTADGTALELSYFAHIPHSSNYKYFILNTCDYKDRIARNQHTKLIRTNDGFVLWAIKDRMMIDVFLSNDGTVTIDASPTAPPVERNLKKVSFYDQKGQLIETVDDLLSFPMWADMTNIGNMFVVMSANNGIHLIAFDQQGDELWQTSVPGIDAKIDFFNSNKYLIYTNSGHTLLIDDKGNVVRDFDFVIRKGTYTDDDRYLIFNVNQDSVHYLSTQNGEVFREKIGDGLSGNSEYYLINLFDKLGLAGVVILDERGIIKGVYVEGGVVSPNRNIIITSESIQLLEVENEK